MTARLRTGLVIAVVVALTPFLFAAAPKDAKTETFTGKVVRLDKLLEKSGVKLDPDAAPVSLALVTDDGKVYPLVKDDGARMFFKDARLLDRPMRLSGRVHAAGGMLQVTTVQSIIKGVPHEVYYWCDICSIRRNEKQLCDCCGAPMELREEKLK
jgi:hypothetical protein